MTFRTLDLGETIQAGDEEFNYRPVGGGRRVVYRATWEPVWPGSVGFRTGKGERHRRLVPVGEE